MDSFVSKDLIGPILIIIGWGILLFNTQRTATRNETRSHCDKCIQKLEDIITLTSGEYQHSHYDLERSISTYLSSLEINAKYIYKKTHQTFINEDAILNLRELSISKDNIDQIQDDALDMIEHIEYNYTKKYGSNCSFKFPFPLQIMLFVIVLLTVYFSLGHLFITTAYNH